MPVAVADPADVEAALADLGRQLKARRKAAGLTQEQLARQTGYKRSTVANAELGDRRSADFWRRVDDELSAGRTFTSRRTATLRQWPGRAASHRCAPGEDAGPTRTVTSPARCPHCRREIRLAAHIILSVAG